MTAKDAMKCVSLLEKAFGWNVWFYTMYISGKEEWLYDIKLAGSRFDDDSPRVFFDKEKSCTSSCFTKAAVVRLFVSHASGALAGAYRRGFAKADAEWKVPEFQSVQELKLKLVVYG